jgi:hypothetical protein
VITQEELKELYDYNPLTGALIFRGKQHNRPSERKPNSNGYHVMMINRKRYYAHRLVWLYLTGEFPPRGMVIDHINRDRNDNRQSNLRLVSTQMNARNTKKNKLNTSGIMGVAWYKRVGKWYANIHVAGKHISLGYFDSLLDACAARKSKEVELGYI